MLPTVVWETLGIAATDDRRAIRSAYASRLKSIDADRDPTAFMTLREALDRAEQMADRARRQGEGASEIDSLDHTASRDRSDASANQDGAPADEDPRLRVLDALNPPDQQLIDPVAVKSAVSALLTHPKMYNVSYAAETEEWLAYILAEGAPATDHAIPVAVVHFNWMEERDSAQRRPVVAFVAQRADDLACIANLRDPDNPWHEAFQVLQRPAPDNIANADWHRLCGPITRLLESIRHHNPGVEGLFDQQHVAMWQDYAYPDNQPKTKIGVGGWVAIAWFVMTLLRILSNGLGS